MTYTTKDDARVAEAVGYTLWQEQRGEYLMQYVFPPGVDANEKYRKSSFERLDWSEYKPGNVETKPKRFLTNATHDTDGIVLEWVQGQDGLLAHQFGYKLKDVVRTNPDYKDTTLHTLDETVMNYRKGDWAKALYALLEEVGDG